MAFTHYVGGNFRALFAEQTTWGTGYTDSSTLQTIYTNDFAIEQQINFRNQPFYHAQRYPLSADVTADKKGTISQVSFQTLALYDQLDNWLYAVFQDVTESADLGGGVYRKTFKFPNSQPDFTNNEGNFYSIWEKSPDASTSRKMIDAICSDLEISVKPETENGLMLVKPTFIARELIVNSNPGSSINNAAIADNYNFFDIGTLTLNSTSIVCGGIIIKISNGATPIGQDNGKVESFVLKRYNAEIDIDVLYSSDYRTLVGYAEAGTEFNFEFSWGSADTDGYLNITGTAKIAVGTKQNLKPDDSVWCPVKLMCCGEYSITEPLQIIMCNNQDRGW
jgi:hypothetical protein